MTVDEFKNYLLNDITDEVESRFYEFSRKLDLLNPDLPPERQPELAWEIGEEGRDLFNAFKNMSGIGWEEILALSPEFMIEHYTNIKRVILIRGMIKKRILTDDEISKFLVR